MKKWTHFADQFGYFLVAVVIVNSVGLWLPYILDWFDKDKLSPENYKALPGNTITYFGGIAAVGILDRIRKVIDMDSHFSKKLEFTGWLFASLTIIALIFWILKLIKKLQIENAVSTSVFGVVISYIIWWIANYKPAPASPYSALGGTLPN